MSTKEEDIEKVINLFSLKSFSAETYRSRPRILVVVFTNPDVSDKVKELDEKTFRRFQSRFMKEPFELPKQDILRIQVEDKFQDAVQILTNDLSMKTYLKEQNRYVEHSKIYTTDWYDKFVFVFLCQLEDNTYDKKNQKLVNPEKIIVGKESLLWVQAIKALGLEDKMKAVFFQIKLIETSQSILEEVDKTFSEITKAFEKEHSSKLKLFREYIQ